MRASCSSSWAGRAPGAAGALVAAGRRARAVVGGGAGGDFEFFRPPAAWLV